MKTKFLLFLILLMLKSLQCLSHHQTSKSYTSLANWKNFENKKSKKKNIRRDKPQILLSKISYSEGQDSSINKANNQAESNLFSQSKYAVLPFIILPFISLVLFVIFILKSYSKFKSYFNYLDKLF